MTNSAPKINSVLAGLHAKGCRVSASDSRWYSPVFNTAEVKSPASVGEVHLRLYFDAEEHWLAHAFDVETGERLEGLDVIEARLLTSASPEQDPLYMCLGSGCTWGTGTVNTNRICRTCHVGYRSLGLKTPGRIVPEHVDARNPRAKAETVNYRLPQALT